MIQNHDATKQGYRAPRIFQAAPYLNPPAQKQSRGVLLLEDRAGEWSFGADPSYELDVAVALFWYMTQDISFEMLPAEMILKIKGMIANPGAHYGKKIWVLCEDTAATIYKGVVPFWETMLTL